MLDIRRRLLAVLLVAASVTVAPGPQADAASPEALAREITFRVRGPVVRRLPLVARNVALYWKGQPDARVLVSFSRDGTTFGPAIEAGRDEIGLARRNGITYGALLTTHRAVALRVTSDRPIKSLTVLGIKRPVKTLVSKLVPDRVDRQTAARPPIVSRAEWGADESLRFRADGSEKWTPAFAPVRKLIVHHTDTRNDDPDPVATIRAIYHYHAITQGWGDIGYNFLIDGAGRIYKGRHSHSPGSSADSITGEDTGGNGVTAAHARNFNTGTVGVALLGSLTNRDATLAAKQALEDLLAWKARRHGIDPHGASTYTNGTGGQSAFPNISGHRDVASTQCPGATFYDQLPAVRNHVAVRVMSS